MAGETASILLPMVDDRHAASLIATLREQGPLAPGNGSTWRNCQWNTLARDDEMCDDKIIRRFAGGFILASVALGWWVSQLFYLFTVFVAVNLPIDFTPGSARWKDPGPARTVQLPALNHAPRPQGRS